MTAHTIDSSSLHLYWHRLHHVYDSFCTYPLRISLRKIACLRYYLSVWTYVLMVLYQTMYMNTWRRGAFFSSSSFGGTEIILLLLRSSMLGSACTMMSGSLYITYVDPITWKIPPILMCASRPVVISLRPPLSEWVNFWIHTCPFLWILILSSLPHVSLKQTESCGETSQESIRNVFDSLSFSFLREGIQWIAFLFPSLLYVTTVPWSTIQNCYHYQGHPLRFLSFLLFCVIMNVMVMIGGSVNRKGAVSWWV